MDTSHISGGECPKVPQSIAQDTKTSEEIVYVCCGKTCSRQSKYILDRLEQVQAKGYKVRAEKCLCMGLCGIGPNLRTKDKIYNRMNPIKASDLAKKLTS